MLQGLLLPAPHSARAVPRAAGTRGHSNISPFQASDLIGSLLGCSPSLQRLLPIGDCSDPTLGLCQVEVNNCRNEHTRQ